MSRKSALQSTFNLFIVLSSCLTLVCSFTSQNGEITLHNSTGYSDVIPYEEWPYDSNLPYMGMQGVIINADPLDACRPILGPPNSTSRYLDWFVLISENSCDYDTKVLHSQLAGYALAVIFKSNGSTANDTKQNWDYTPSIPVIIISENSHTLVQEYSYFIDNGSSVFIISNRARTYSMILGSLFLSLAGLVFIYKVIIKPLRSSFTCTLAESDRTASSMTSLLKRLGTSRYWKGYAFTTCVICFEDFKLLQRIRKLPCSHGFHVQCIDQWLLNEQRTCPVCKQDVSVQDRNGLPATETTPLLQNSNTSVNSINA